ncbi:MAG: peptidase S1 [Sulfurimonas sp.]|nr:MAG: peptidase S1 [Sulfurimonas sp.]
MKKIILVCLLILTALNAKDNIKFKYADSATQRKYPNSSEYILSYNNILQNVRTSVVNISTKKTLNSADTYINPYMQDPLFREFFKNKIPVPKERIQSALGSGVIISEDGYIVTNNHVVDGANSIKVTIAGDKKEYKAKIIGTDKKSDLAIIKIEAVNLNAITFYNSDEVKVGDITFALGNPFGLGETITQGIVSATRRSGVGIVEYEDFIQTDASINPGNSGGALINSAGHLIGINSAILSKSGGNIGIGFAIPSNMVSSIATELIKKGKFTRAYLGVSISNISDEMSSFYNNQFGALITSVMENTPASDAGLKRGDLIISINGKKISSASELKNTIGSYPPSRVVNIKFLRDKKIDIINVQLASLDDRSDPNQYSYMGMKLEALSSNTKARLGITTNLKGLFVSEIEKDNKVKKSGIKVGDIIIQVENIGINNVNDFKRATSSSEKKRFYVFRNGGIFVTIL